MPALPFEATPAVVGMVHLPPLPGAPGYESRRAVRERAVADAAALVGGGVDAVMIENFGDAPFHPDDVPKHVVAELTAVAATVADRVDVPLGVNVLRNDAAAALSVAGAVGADVVRVNVHAGARLTDQGIVEGRAHETMRLRERIDATDVAVLADVGVKHSGPLGDRPFAAEFRDAVERGLADGVVVSGPATGEGVADGDLAEATALGEELDVPVLVGSGVTAETAGDLLADADGAIVGTALKTGGAVDRPVEEGRVAALMERVRTLR